MLPDNFRFFIPFEALGAGVPFADVTRCVEHIDGIVSHRIDEQTVAACFIQGMDGGMEWRGGLETVTEDVLF